MINLERLEALTARSVRLGLKDGGRVVPGRVQNLCLLNLAIVARAAVSIGRPYRFETRRVGAAGFLVLIKARMVVLGWLAL